MNLMIQKESKFKPGDPCVPLLVDAKPPSIIPGQFKIMGVRMEGCLVYNSQQPVPIESAIITYWIDNGKEEALGVKEEELLTLAEALEYPTFIEESSP